jgi:hypothetical protein
VNLTTGDRNIVIGSHGGYSGMATPHL